MRGSLICLGILLGAVPVALRAQSLQQRITAVGSGTVHLSYPARPGVCGEGPNRISTDGRNEEWEDNCESQPVRVALKLEDRRVVGIRTYVGGRWRPGSAATDLGTVRPQEAAAYFLALAQSSAELAGDPVLPATLADSVTVWPSLVRLARATELPSETRRSAIFWLSQAAGKAAATALDSLAFDDKGDREIRKQAVFALSQRPDHEGVPALIRIARSNSDPQLRKTALFWLGQSEDPRALDLFEEILR
jgi:HEAT repeat protein